MTHRLVLGLAACLLMGGCRNADLLDKGNTVTLGPHELAQAANRQFLSQKPFDPWVLKGTGAPPVPAYVGDGHSGTVISVSGRRIQTVGFKAGHYVQGRLQSTTSQDTAPLGAADQQVLDLRTGRLTVGSGPGARAFSSQNGHDWGRLWQTTDIVIDGDPEAQQVTHANLFYLLSSTFPGSDHSIPPLGLSSAVYGGHIFWDADVWMLPALVVQHPEYARPIIDYRFRLLAQARRNAAAHGNAGAEFPWESADTGREVAPAEFATERHITADVAFAAWQYFLWTGDRSFLEREGWPLLQATAAYWVSRVTGGPDGRYHIRAVLSPDETAGTVDDDAYTNAVVRYNLRATVRAARLLHRSADPRWSLIAGRLFFPYDRARRIPAENSQPLTDRFAAKQADVLLLLHPLNQPFDRATAGRMLDFYAGHTIRTGPAMTASIHAVVAARLGRGPQARELFQDSYRPFERGPWDAFSEKRTTNTVYFLTGMAGCIQSVLYGFAGLTVQEAGKKGTGTRLAGDATGSLYADPHLPPGWKKLTIQGIRFHGARLDLTVLPDGRVVVKKRGT